MPPDIGVRVTHDQHRDLVDMSRQNTVSVSLRLKLGLGDRELHRVMPDLGSTQARQRCHGETIWSMPTT